MKTSKFTHFPLPLCFCRSKDNMQNTAVLLLDMGEYMYCPPGQQLPLALEAKDLQQQPGAASGAVVTGLPGTAGAKSKAGAAVNSSSLQPPPLPPPPPKGSVKVQLPQLPVSGSSSGKSRLRFDLLPEKGPVAAKQTSISSLSSTMMSTTTTDSKSSTLSRISPSWKQVQALSRLNTQREVALLRVYQVN